MWKFQSPLGENGYLPDSAIGQLEVVLEAMGLHRLDVGHGGHVEQKSSITMNALTSHRATKTAYPCLISPMIAFCRL